MDSDDDIYPSETSDNDTDSENDNDEHYLFPDPETMDSQPVVSESLLYTDGRFGPNPSNSQWAGTYNII